MTSHPFPRRRNRRDTIEILEARIAPATLVSLNGVTHVLTVQGDHVDDGSGTVQAGAPETLVFTFSGGALTISDSSHGVTAVGAGVSQAGTGQVNVPTASLTGDIVIDTGTGADSLSFDGILTLAANKSLTAHTTGTINFAPTSALTATGTGKLSLTTDRDISIAPGAPGATLSVVNGDLDLTAHGTLSGTYSGISIGGKIMSTGTGKITLTGTGGNTNDGNNGIDVHGQITAAGAGSVRLVGQGGAGNNANTGIYTSSGTISSGVGGIFLKGTPGGDAGDSLGIDLAIAVTSGGDIDFMFDKGLRFDPGTAVNASAGVVSFTPVTANTAITLGSFQQAAFGLSDAMLGVVTANKVVIGSAVAGAIAVNGAIDSQNSLTLKSGSTVGGLADFGVAAGKSLSIEAAGTIQLQGAVSVSAGVLSLSGVGGAAGGIGVSLLNAGNDFDTVHVVNGASVELRDLDGFGFDAQATTLLSLNSGGTITQIGPITGGADLLKLGSGTLRLTQANTVGDTTIGAGSLVFSDPGAFGSGTITLGSSTVGSVDVSLIAGGGIPSGSFVNQIVVPNILGGGVVKIGSAVAPGAVHYQGAMTLNRATTFESANTGGTFYEGAISGNVGTLTIEGGGRSAFRLATNSFTGDVKLIGASTLELLGGADEIPDSSNVFIEQGSFFLLSKTLNLVETIANLTGSGTVSTSSTRTTPQTLGITAATGTSFQFDGFIADGAAPLSIIKDGAGTAHLEGELTYSGPTIVKGGTLQLVNPDSSDSIANSSIIDVRSGATLDVLGLGGAGITQTLVLAPTQTLMGSGTILGNLTGTGKVFPGDPTTAGILTINGNFTTAGQVGFKLNSPYTTPGVDFDQIVIAPGSGVLDLGGAQILLFGGTTAPAAGTMIKLIANNGPSATVAGNSPVEGGVIGVGASAFTVNYNAGNGSDVVLTGSPGQVSLSAALNKGALTISDTGGRPHRLDYFVSGPNIIINDPVEFFSAAPAGAQLQGNGHVLSIPVSLVKGVQVNGGLSDDSLTVDLGTSSTKLPAGGIVFNGGLQATSVGDQLVLRGVNEGAVAYTYTSPSAGTVALASFGKITLAGLESVVNKGNATSQIFNLPAGGNFAALGDDDTAGNGLTRLSGATFPLTDFTSPVSGVTINPGGASDLLTLDAVPDFDADLAIGSPLHPFAGVSALHSVDFTQAIDLEANTFFLAGGLHLSAAGGILALGGGTIGGALGGGLGIIKTAGTAAAGVLTLAEQNTYTGETVVQSGSLTLANTFAAQNSTVRILNGGQLQFTTGFLNFSLGGLAGPGALSLANTIGGPIQIDVGSNDSTYAGVLSGPGTLHKTGAGTLTLTGKNTHTSTFIDNGILQINSDAALGAAGAPFIGDGGTLQAAATTTVARNIVLQSDTTFQASAGKTLTLSGIISGSGDFLVGDIGTVLVTGQANTNTGGVELGGGASEMVNGVSISTPGIHSGVMVTPGATSGDIAKIDLTGVNVPVTLVLKSPKTGTEMIERIISTDATPVKMISLGARVTLGNGTADALPDLEVDGSLTTLQLSDVSANALIQLGKDLPYLATYKNAPNVTLHDVLGAGVVIDVTGNGISGLLGGIGGGGLGKIVVNSWAAPGLIETTQSIKSFTVKTGDSHVSIEVDPNHLGTLTTGNVGLVSIPAGQWAGASMQVEGVVAQFLTKGLAEGSTITAGAFGTVNIKGDFAGSIISTFAAPMTGKVIATGAIGNVTIVGNFTGLINGDGKVGNVTISGTGNFLGTLRGGSIGNISAASFNGSGATVGDPRHTITAIGSIGNITARSFDLTNYIIAAGTDLGSDALFGGVADTFTSYYSTATHVKTAVSIGTVTIKGVVQGTTIAAGVDPGADGVYGDVNDLVMAPPPGFTGKTKIGAMTFDATVGSALGFSDTAPTTVSNAFEAQVLTSVKFGTGAANPATNPQYRKVFTDAKYIDSGGSSIVVRLLA